MSQLESNKIFDALQTQYGEDIKMLGEGAQAALLVEPHRLLELFQELKTNALYQFNMLRNLTAVDYQEYMEIVYHLYSLPLRQMITVKTRTAMEDAEVPSVTGLWPAANFQEREIYDLLGVKFSGHPDLRRILMPEEFSGHPLRKAYITGNTAEKR